MTEKHKLNGVERVVIVVCFVLVILSGHSEIGWIHKLHAISSRDPDLELFLRRPM
jgi:TRAP-type mannitol/chloroaromatic compound transport system permease small subunit